MFAQRLASASKPALATVVDHARVPSAVSARHEVDRARRDPMRSSAAAAGEVVAGDLEVAGEVVARPGGHDREHAVVLGGDARRAGTRVPSPPHATTPRPSSNAPRRRCGPRRRGRPTRRSARRRRRPRARREMCGSCVRPRPRPAAGLITAVQRSGSVRRRQLSPLGPTGARCSPGTRLRRSLTRRSLGSLRPCPTTSRPVSIRDGSPRTSRS